MNTKNTKTAVIFLLIIANIFFVYNIINLKISSENISSEMIDDAVSILTKNGFMADRNKIPAKKPSYWIYEGEYAQDIWTDIVRNFSGVSGDEMTGGMFGPFGITYTAGDYKFIFSKADYFKISVIEKNYGAPEKDFEKFEEETEFLSEKGIGEVKKSDIKKAEKAIKNFIKKYQNQDVKSGFDIVGFEEDRYENRECALINQTVDGMPVDSHMVYIEIQDGEVKYFWGTWHFGGFVSRDRWTLLDSVNILFKCWEIDGNSIQEDDRLSEMNLEYNVIHYGARFYLVPSWQLAFESGKSFSYNMITGDKAIKS